MSKAKAIKRTTKKAPREALRHMPSILWSATKTHTAESWSYCLNAKTREVYVRVFEPGKQVLAISVRVPR